VDALARNQWTDWPGIRTLSGEKRHPLAEAAWKDTEVLFPQEAPERWKNAVTGEKITGRGGVCVAEIHRIFPAALLISEGIP